MEIELDKLIDEAASLEAEQPVEPDETEPVQSEQEPVKSEPVEVEPVAKSDPEPDPAPVQVEQHDEIAQQPDFTEREKALYAQAQRYKKQRSQSQDEIAKLSESQARLQHQMMEFMQKMTPQSTKVEQTPVDEFDPDEFITGRQVSNIEQRILKRLQEHEQAKQQQEHEYKTRYLTATEQACARFYDDFETVVAPVLDQIGKEPGMIDKILTANDPVKAAKLVYARATELSKPIQTTKQQPVLPMTRTVAPNRSIPNSEKLGKLTDEQISFLVSRLSSEDEINALLKMVSQ